MPKMSIFHSPSKNVYLLVLISSNYSGIIEKSKKYKKEILIFFRIKNYCLRIEIYYRFQLNVYSYKL